VLYQANLPFWTWLLGDVIGVDLHSRVGDSVLFFVYDTTKILLLLAGIIFAVTILRSFMSVERTHALLGGRREGLGNAAAAGLGVVTRFCSCSAVPAFIGFVAAGVPLGVSLSFLIASPLVNEVAVVMLYGLFGWEIALLYRAAGLVIATGAGYILGRLHLEAWVERFVFETRLIGAYVAVVATSIVAIGYGVMSTPALVIDDEVVVSGRVPGADQLRALIDAPAPPSERAVGSAAWGNSIADHGSTLMASWAQWRERRVDWRVWRVLNGER
jgi:uncharacterized membrane protein YraQ (UPF0718 family)